MARRHRYVASCANIAHIFLCDVLAAPGDRVETLTLLVMRLLQPLGAEEPLRQESIPTVDDKRLATEDNVHQDDFLEFLLAKAANLAPRDSLNPLEVWCVINQSIKIQIGRNRIKPGLRMRRRRHLCRAGNRMSAVLALTRW